MNEISLPQGWMWTTLQEVCSAPQYGWTTKASSQGTLRLLRTTDITADSLSWDTVPFCSEEPPDKEKYLLKTGDIVISRAGSVGCSYLIKNPPNAVFASYLIRFCPLPMIDEYYLSFFLKSSFYWNTISSEKTGSTLPNVNATKLKRVPVPLPSLPEQHAIAHVLQTIQEAKFARQREIALERERKAALMDFLFSHGTKGEPRKQTEIGEIPESWEVTKLGDLVKLKSGVSRPKHMESQPNAELTIPVYGGNGILGYTSKRFSEERLLVIGRVGAYCGCVHIAEAPNWITDNALYPEKWFSSEVSLDFLAEQLKHCNLNRLQRRGGQPLVTQSILHQFKIPLPPFPEQRAIAAVFQAIDEKISVLEREVELIDELFHAMLDELMTGKKSAVPLIENGEIQ